VSRIPSSIALTGDRQRDLAALDQHLAKHQKAQVGSKTLYLDIREAGDGRGGTAYIRTSRRDLGNAKATRDYLVKALGIAGDGSESDLLASTLRPRIRRALNLPTHRRGQPVITDVSQVSSVLPKSKEAGSPAKSVPSTDSQFTSLGDGLDKLEHSFVESMHINTDKVMLKKGQTPQQFVAEMRRAYSLLDKQGFGWRAAADAFHQGKISEDEMISLTRFRKHVVDGIIDDLRAKHGDPPLIAKSVGSTDPTSDYDITFSTPGSGNDVIALREFNATVKQLFGKQSGTVFDTNIYAKDYIRVKEKIRTELTGSQQPDSHLEKPGHTDMNKTVAVDQDVAGFCPRYYRAQTSRG